MLIREMKYSEIDKLIWIGKETYEATFGAQNTEETMTRYLEDAFNMVKLTGEFEQEGTTFYFVTEEHSLCDHLDVTYPEIIGYLKINLPPDQSDLNAEGSLEVERIYLRSFAKGMGYGRRMIEFAENLAAEKNCEFIWLGVWEENHDALKFYNKMGFEKFSEHPYVMGDEVQTDFLMRKTL